MAAYNDEYVTLESTNQVCLDLVGTRPWKYDRIYGACISGGLDWTRSVTCDDRGGVSRDC
jgi:hypothetical protein